jgi:hypothetical protein
MREMDHPGTGNGIFQAVILPGAGFLMSQWALDEKTRTLVNSAPKSREQPLTAAISQTI